jgi:hypothetical protein
MAAIVTAERLEGNELHAAGRQRCPGAPAHFFIDYEHMQTERSHQHRHHARRAAGLSKISIAPKDPRPSSSRRT